MYHERLTASPSRGMATQPRVRDRPRDSRRPRPSRRTSSARAVGDHGNGACSNDGGKSWAPFAAQPALAKDAPGPIATNTDGSVLLWTFVHWDGTKYPAHRSTDNGATWSEVSTFPKGATPLADPADPTRFYAYDTDTGTLFASTDSGLTFTARATGLPSGDSQFQLAAAPGRSGDLWLSTKCERPVPVHRRRSDLHQARPAAGPRTPSPSARPPRAPTTRRSTRSAPRRRSPPCTAPTTARRPGCGSTTTGTSGAGSARPSPPTRGIYGRVYIATNGRGIQYGEPV